MTIENKTTWCLGIDHLELCEDANVLRTYFYPHNKDCDENELKRFVSALTEFVKNYNCGRKD